MSQAQPLFFDPGTTAAFTAAGGLVFTGAGGATVATIPTGALVLGGIAKKLLLEKAFFSVLESQQQREQQRRYPQRHH